MSAISTKPLRDRLCKLPNEDALCPVCKDIPYEDPVQSTCGHRFCKPCIGVIAGNNSDQCICPIDSLQLFPTFSDRFYRRDIKNSECHCVFNTEGCSWKGILADLEEHEKNCDYVEVTCAQCGASITKKTLQLHERNDCAHRLVPCRHCSQPVQIDRVDDHDLQCKEIPIDCPHNCGAPNLTRQSLDDHLLTYCCKVLHACQFEDYGCEFKGNWKEQEKHRSENLEVHMILLLKNDKQQQVTVSGLVQENRRLENVLNELTEKLHTALSQKERSDAVIKEHETKLAEASYQKERTDALASQVEEVIQSIRLQGRSTKQLEETVTGLTLLGADESRKRPEVLGDIENRLWLLENGSSTGHYTWKIEHFSRHLCEAREGKRDHLVSAPFNVDRFGYKLCVVVYPNGEGSGKGTDVSVFVAIMKGAYDQVLEWPFALPIRIALLGKHRKMLTRNITPTLYEACFRRPEAQMNPGFGVSKFCSLSLLEQEYVHDDTLFLSVSVTTDTGLPFLHATK